MPRWQPEDWGIPLWDAIERWTPRKLWERYRELARYDIPLLIRGQPQDPRQTEAWTLQSEISKILINRLVRGELIASGIALPLKETSRRRYIRPEVWAHLTFSDGFSSATGKGIRYESILIRETSSVRRGYPEVQAWSRHEPARPVGRPSIMPMIEAEMRRRATLGLIEVSLSREAKVLAIWAQREFPNAHVPKPKSIEKRLREIYKELDPKKRPDK